MKMILDEMNKCYTALSEVEAEVLVDAEGRLLNLIMAPIPSHAADIITYSMLLYPNWHKPRNLEANKQKIMNLFVKCTKHDVTLNNYKTRARSLV